MGDRISELSDLVISSILSRLQIKDLVKTSALSSKWRHNWSLFSQNFTLDIPNLFGNDFETPNFSSKEEHYSLFKEFRQQFIARVDGFLHNFKGTKIISFKVLFFMDSEVSFKVDIWIAKAIELGAEEIQLFFSKKPFFLKECSFIPPNKYYTFPTWLFSSQSTTKLSHLYLQKCILSPLRDFNGFSKLRTLQLEQVILFDDFVDTLFSNSPILEKLKLKECIFWSNSVLKVYTSSIHNLLVLNCRNLFRIEISTLNLMALEFSGYNCELVLMVAPSLSKIYFNILGILDHSKIPHICSKFENISRLEILTLNLDFEKTRKIPRETSAFKNVKQLELFYSRGYGEDLMCVLDILNASPILEKFVCRITASVKEQEYEQKIKEIKEDPKHSYRNLKQVEIVGCSGYWFEIEMIMCILKNVIALEQLLIDPKGRYYVGGEEWLCYEPNPFWFQSGHHVLLRSLHPLVIPLTLQIVIL